VAIRIPNALARIFLSFRRLECRPEQGFLLNLVRLAGLGLAERCAERTSRFAEKNEPNNTRRGG
jgi:hypothetical protein